MIKNNKFINIFKNMHKETLLGIIFLVLVIIPGVISFFYTPYDPDAMDAALKNSAPTFGHIFGCDNFGRDLFSRVAVGIGNTFCIALFTVLIGAFFGIIIGSITGYFGGIVDEILMRINDALYAFPAILLALVVVSLLGTGTGNVVIALGIAFIPSFARMVRAEMIKQKSMDYVLSARLYGASSFRIMFIHILPNITPVLISSIMIGFNNAVLAEAGLSYLGIGVQPPTSSLGRMLSESQSYLFTNPWNSIFPGLAIIIMVLGFSLVAEGIGKRNTK